MPSWLRIIQTVTSTSSLTGFGHSIQITGDVRKGSSRNTISSCQKATDLEGCLVIHRKQETDDPTYGRGTDPRQAFPSKETSKFKSVVAGKDPGLTETMMEERRFRYDLQNQQKQSDAIVVSMSWVVLEKSIRSAWFLMAQTRSFFTITIRQDRVHHLSWNPP